MFGRYLLKCCLELVNIAFIFENNKVYMFQLQKLANMKLNYKNIIKVYVTTVFEVWNLEIHMLKI
jgi:hypothetical protein